LASYLVTGGCGFIGSHLIDGLVSDGHKVRILDDLSTGKAEQAHPAAELVVGSVTDRSLVRELMGNADGCFHLAAIASVPRCTRDLVASHRINLGGFMHLLEAARINRPPTAIVFASSAAVYGVTDGVATEATPPAPISHYGCDKLACELHARAALEGCGLSSIGLRFFNVYGPRQDPNSPYAGVISIFARAAERGDVSVIFGDGLQTRDFVYVSDVVRAQRLAMAHLRRQIDKGEGAASVFNVCTGIGTTIGELAQRVFAAFSREPKIVHEPRREGDIRFSLGATEAAAAVLGFRAATTLGEGLAEFAAWYMNGRRSVEYRPGAVG
jgi:UDP-glucose 4-epimerase